MPALLKTASNKYYRRDSISALACTENIELEGESKKETSIPEDIIVQVLLVILRETDTGLDFSSHSLTGGREYPTKQGASQ